jgi:cellulose synthase/poly-beta-1,6-N-acetylglucosamine synthase-like glycosyltransferase
MLSLLVIGSTVLALAYCGITWANLHYWARLQAFANTKEHAPKTKISLIVAARNEAQNIASTLRSLLAQTYPTSLLEIIVVDDFSTDATADVVRAFAQNASHLRLIQVKDYLQDEALSSKKKALEIAIGQAKGKLVVCTDADCSAGAHWLATIEAFYVATGAVFIAAPINFHQEKSLLERFQSLDLLGMMGVTGAGMAGRYAYMCNGANMAYEREAFLEVGGYEGNAHKASGDDMFLLHKMAARWPGRVHFLKAREATVFTPAEPNWSRFVQQRLRWGTKNAAYQDMRVTLVLGLVFFFCWSLLLNLFLSIFVKIFFYLFLFQIIVKIICDYVFLSTLASFFHRRSLLRLFLPSVAMHIVYIAGIGLLANLVKSYQWKGRIQH